MAARGGVDLCGRRRDRGVDQRRRLVPVARASRMILVGIDDTDTLDTPGTNQLARRLADVLPPGFTCDLALRHQLFFDPRVPYTSKNGSARCAFVVPTAPRPQSWSRCSRRRCARGSYQGADPGLCVADTVPDEVRAFGLRCQREVVTQEEARRLAAGHGLYLEGFGGTEGGVIGALAAVGLLAGGDDGRVVHLAGWQWPDDFAGPQPVAAVLARGVEEIIDVAQGAPIWQGVVDVGKHLRPSYRGGRVVLFVEAEDGADRSGRWRARKLA